MALKDNLDRRLLAEQNDSAIEDTIAAIATPVGRGGIGIIRISGREALSIARKLFRAISKQGRDPERSIGPQPEFDAHRLNYGHIIDPVTGYLIDETLMVVMPAPHSYTREEVVEFQIHGGPVILNKLMHLVLQNGARLADPGEFTRRAFVNGRIDLSQAEAVIDLINAKSETSLLSAAGQLGGNLKSRIQTIINDLSFLVTDLEAGIEFPEEVGKVFDRSLSAQNLQTGIIAPIKRLISSYQSGHMLRDGIRIAIVGRPNVGKSSLLNALIDRNRAIVTEIPGTTRDPIEESTTIDGLPIVLTDTAGLHESKDQVEIIGIQKTHETLSNADLVLFVIEANVPFDIEDRTIFNRIQDKRILLVQNKIDLTDSDHAASVPRVCHAVPRAKVSALKGTGIARLKREIVQICFGDEPIYSQSTIVTNLRHKNLLEEALASLEQAMGAMATGLPEDLISMDLQSGTNALKRLTGELVSGEVLDAIFKRFCIGK